ncbi:RNA binding protein, heterogenous nuclear RNP-K like protein [Coemansia sp. BCRC 34301]|nr:RNA binding protein, heterogenous nuclear RNP-K like protein [Coemansia sp. BCRC 34301]
MTYVAEEHICSRLPFAVEHHDGSDIELDADYDVRLLDKAAAATHTDMCYSDTTDICCEPSYGGDDKSTISSDEVSSLKRPVTPGSARPDTDSAAGFQATATPQILLRLLFLPEDGGMLIGKSGCHINKLKASSTATWSITGSNTNKEDRVVIISSTLEGVVNAIHTLTEHMDQQQQIAATFNSSAPQPTYALTLRLLFPASCIGLVIGPGGARVSKLRVDSKIDRVHIYRDSICHTDERVIEICGTRQSLCHAVELMLRETGPTLAKQQSVSTLYKPAQNGFRRLQSQERQSRDLYLPNHEMLTDSYRPSPSKEKSRNRSFSLVGFGEADSDHDTSGKNKQKRRMSDNPESERRPSKRRVSDAPGSSRESDASRRLGRADRYSPPQLNRRSSASTRSSHSASSSRKHSPDDRSKEEKMVIPDSVAGRLIGRKGSYLLSLENQSGAQISLSPRVQNMTDRIVTVVGRTDEVRAACKLIKSSVQSFEDLEA